jgi:hypothetical protein
LLLTGALTLGTTSGSSKEPISEAIQDGDLIAETACNRTMPDCFDSGKQGGEPAALSNWSGAVVNDQGQNSGRSHLSRATRVHSRKPIRPRFPGHFAWQWANLV